MSSKFKLTLVIIAVAVTSFTAATFAPDLHGSNGDKGVILKAPNVFTVDIEEVTNDYLRRTGDVEVIENAFLTERRALEVLRSTIEAMDQESEVYPKDSAEYLNLRTQIAIKGKEFELRNQSTKMSRDRDKAKLMREAYEKALKEIEGYARQTGADLVLLKQTGKIKGSELAEVASNILVRSVLYSSDLADKTEEIKERMK